MRYASLIVTKRSIFMLDDRAFPVTDVRTWNMSHLISTLDSRISMLAGMSTHPAPVYPERNCLSDKMLGHVSSTTGHLYCATCIGTEYQNGSYGYGSRFLYPLAYRL